MAKNHWAMVNRGKGQSYSDWMNANNEAHIEEWRMNKIQRGEWLPADEFEKLHNRLGKKLSSTLEWFADHRRKKK